MSVAGDQRRQPVEKVALRSGGRFRGGSQRGDLYLRLQPVLPAREPAELKPIADQMEPLYAGQDLRAELRRSLG